MKHEQLKAGRLEAGLTQVQAARRLGVSLAKVKTDILRARAALAKILSRGGESAPALSL